MNISQFHVWAIVRFLPDMQQVVINRFRRRSEAEECLRVLRRDTPCRNYTLLYYPPGEEATFMVRKEYNKLVRDRIPDILESQKVRFGVKEMTQAEFCQALRQKLTEEAQEVAEAVEASFESLYNVTAPPEKWFRPSKPGQETRKTELVRHPETG